MKNNTETIIETITMPHGLEVDVDEAWRKLIQRQFGGSPGRGFSELIQNLLDSYPSDVEWADRKGIIETEQNRISITDFGEGMTRTRLRLLTTLGGTDKNNNTGKIGQFGIGFFSIFNPGLFTKKVTVLTMCEGHGVELVFTINDPEKLPHIQSRLLNKNLPFSTKIEVEFDNSRSPEICLDYARKSLTYYPCCVEINGSIFVSIWEKAKQKGLEIFSSGQCTGFIENRGYGGSYVNLLRRYEKIMNLSIDMLITGGRSMKFDLRDWARKKTPYLPEASITINCNNLNVPISRDGFYLDFAFHSMVNVLNDELLKVLYKDLKSHQDSGLILTNQYILKDKIKDFLTKSLEKDQENDVEPVIKYLAQAKIYTLNGRLKKYSLADIYNMRSKDLPVFFSPLRTNLRWLGGAFKHDFIILPPFQNNLNISKSAPDFYDTLFEKLFSDIINLDEIEYNNEKMADLVKREIIDKSSLSPDCSFVGARRLSEKENECITKIDRILEHETIKKAITKNLYLRVSSVRAAFFEIHEAGGVIATGLFDEQGNPLDEDNYSNFSSDNETSENNISPKPIFLGLQRDHEFINSLIETKDKYSAYYMLMYLSHELALCQKLLVPYSPYFHVVKERLARDMRQALMDHLLVDLEKTKEKEIAN
ncbi:MAG: ATP-binding protein [Desulfobacteraceae bacterium]|nr:ATP-binding protein [Desulfobacteraceae bacterium]